MEKDYYENKNRKDLFDGRSKVIFCTFLKKN